MSKYRACMPKPVVNIYQPAMTEWYAALGEPKEAEKFRIEDNYKAERQEILYQTIGLEYERPVKFSAKDLIDKSPVFTDYLKAHSEELCALRLVPIRGDLPKIRQRGLSLAETYNNWFLNQKIDHAQYDAYIYPHSEVLLWSASLVVNQDGIIGEIARGLHSQLTHGEMINIPYQFLHDFKNWQWSQVDVEAEKLVHEIISKILVTDEAKREKLKKELSAEFAHNYLVGYFEITVWPNGKIFFIDYNRLIPKRINIPKYLFKHESSIQSSLRIDPSQRIGVAIHDKIGTVIKGIGANPGRATGRVVIVPADQIGKINFPDKSILVVDNTDIRFVPLMKKAGAIVANRGGLLSHAAIVSRELGIPCIIGTKTATQVLKTGDLVEVDAELGIIRKI